MGGSGNLSRTCDLSAWNLSIRLELFSNQFISPKFSDDSWHSMLLRGKNVPWNSEGSRGYMYGEDCCESCPVTHLVHLRHHTFARFYSGSFSWFMLPLRFLTYPQRISAKNWILPLDILIWKLNRKSRKLFGVLDNQPFSGWIRWGGSDHIGALQSRAQPITATPALACCPPMVFTVLVSKQKESWSGCRTLLLRRIS